MGRSLKQGGEHPHAIDMFVRGTKKHIELFSLFFGSELGPVRLEAIRLRLMRPRCIS